MEKLKVIITGAGIGGLTAGIALRRAGCEVEIYDRVKELRPVGAGISLWSNGAKVLTYLGMGEQLAAIGGTMNQMAYHHKTGQQLNKISLLPLIDSVGQRPYPVARRDLQNMLLKAYGDEIKLDHKCVGVEEDETGVTVFFENGHQTKGDVLIAADGIRSTVRKYVLGVDADIEPKYAGYVNWNGLVKASPDLVAENTWVIYVGDHQRASMMPIGGDRLYFFFDVPLAKGTPCNPELFKAELKEHFQGWAEPVQMLIDRFNPSDVARIEIHDAGPFNRYVRGRVALLGDSAHATCPDMGQGGCLALEDALVVADHLVNTHAGVERALRRYEAERMIRANAIVQKARKRAEQIHGKDPAITQQWYQQLATEKPSDVTDALKKVILGGPLR
ncbi:monooxygenase [Aphanothece hegewaldii CCALA 016]|uniref:FAD-dependent urate hydroxylase n=1 Tax=Aphanothece hegewaldii CCALA 016 TaxID=2107694 RepID=A0A2T1LZV2_9CHRO|nr:FAD-dependent urate hydroxylase HpxO [Aphanothece hegewaldii]PSF37900.1 monooxygenase [Aphanothece hegewaldii CCALA 016]